MTDKGGEFIFLCEKCIGEAKKFQALHASIKELKADNESLRAGRCRFDCAKGPAEAKRGFMAGYKVARQHAGLSYEYDVLGAYKEWRA